MSEPPPQTSGIASTAPLNPLPAGSSEGLSYVGVVGQAVDAAPGAERHLAVGDPRLARRAAAGRPPAPAPVPGPPVTDAHNVLSHAGMQVISGGTGNMVRLPGPTADQPNSYAFGTPYEVMYQDLLHKDSQLYTANGILAMLDRNRRVKRAPQQWRELKQTADVVITCEEHCFDSVCEDLLARDGELNRAVHVINVEIRDSHQDALAGGRVILELAQAIEASADPDQDLDGILLDLSSRHPHKLLHNVLWY